MSAPPDAGTSLPPIIQLPDQSQPPRRKRSGSTTRQRLEGVFVRLLPAELVRLEVESADAGCSVAAHLRAGRLGQEAPVRMIRRRRLPEIDAKAVARSNAELNKIGSLLNQAVRAINTIALDEGTGRLAEAAHILRPIEPALDELRLTLAATRRALGHDREG